MTDKREAERAEIKIRSAELPTLEHDAAELINLVDVMRVETEEENELAADTVKAIKEKISSAEALRKSLVGPINDHVKSINAAFRKVTEPLERAMSKLKAKMVVYIEAETVRRRAEAEAKRRLEEEEALKKAEALEKAGETEAADAYLEKEAGRQERAEKRAAAKPTTRGLASTAYGRKVWAFEIVDQSAIPREYLDVNSTRILAEIRRQAAEGKGQPTIPGIRAFQRSEVGVR